MPINNPLSAWSSFQKETLLSLGVDTLDILQRSLLDESSSDDPASEYAQMFDSDLDNIDEESDSSNFKKVDKLVEQEEKKITKPEPISIVEEGQRAAWGKAIQNAHGCFVTAKIETSNGNTLLIVTESPKVTIDSSAPFVDSALDELTKDILSSIGLYTVTFTCWREVIDYLPYERRDDSEPDVDRFYTDFSDLLTDVTHILAFGQLTSKLILKSTATIGKLREKPHVITHDGHDVFVNAMFHPAFLLRSPMNKAILWQDLKAFYRSVNKQKLI